MQAIIEARVFEIKWDEIENVTTFTAEGLINFVAESTVIGLVDEFQWSSGDEICVVVIDDDQISHIVNVQLNKRWDTTILPS